MSDRSWPFRERLIDDLGAWHGARDSDPESVAAAEREAEYLLGGPPNGRVLTAVRDLFETATRLSEAIADKAAVDGLVQSGHITHWKPVQDADDAFHCAMQDMRTALDGRERPHVHHPLINQQAEGSPG